MSERANLVRVLTTATGNSTPITLGAAYSQLFMTPAEAGAIDGRSYTYLIVDGNNWELGKGVYSAAGSTLARTIILGSRSGGTLGTSRISLSGTAQVRFVEAAEDMGGVRGTRVVTSTSDALANSDLNRPVTYNNASAIAVTLAQAGASNLFLDGWATYIRNIGAGTVTITPATSTINGASTLAIAQGLGAFIWSDGTNYHAFILPNSKPLLAANNLSDLASAATARGNIGVDTATLTKTAAYTIVAADYGALIKCNGSFTVALTAAATLGDKFKVHLRNTSTGIITLDPNGSETINERATVNLYPGESCTVICDGTTFQAIGLSQGWVTVQQYSFSGVTGLQLGGISSDCAEHRLLIRNTTIAGAASGIVLRAVKAGAPIATTNYMYGLSYVNPTAAGFANGSSGATFIALSDFSLSTAAGSLFAADVRLPNWADVTAGYKPISFQTSINNGLFAAYNGGGWCNDSAAFDGVAIYPNAGTFTGEVQLIGLRR